MQEVLDSERQGAPALFLSPFMYYLFFLGGGGGRLGGYCCVIHVDFLLSVVVLFGGGGGGGLRLRDVEGSMEEPLTTAPEAPPPSCHPTHRIC